MALRTIAWSQRPVNIPRNPRVAVVAEGYQFTEGPSVDRDSNVYFTDCGGHRIMKVTPQGAVTEFVNTGGTPAGTKWRADGKMVATDAGRKVVLEISADGKDVRVLTDNCDGQPYQSTNDLTVDRNGNIYFTDPGGSSLQNPIGAVYYLPKDGKSMRVAEGLAFPNGIALSPDGKALFIAESQKNRVLRYEIRRGGALGAMTEYVRFKEKGSPDGIGFDEDGNLFVAHFGAGAVRVVAPKTSTIGGFNPGIGNRAPTMAREGEHVADIRLPATNVTNVAFGGPKRQTLYITANRPQNLPSALYKVELPVRGLKLPPGTR